MRPLYFNPGAQNWTSQPAATDEIRAFHLKFPLYLPTPLISLPEIAKGFGVKEVYVKYEGERCGLPSFKILGASWAAVRAIVAYIKLPIQVTLNDLAVAAQNRGVILVCATDGNHGRALARVARILGIESRILVPRNLDSVAISLIEEEGAEIIVTKVDYDGAVMMARTLAGELENGILVQDTAFGGYEEIPQVCACH